MCPLANAVGTTYCFYICGIIINYYLLIFLHLFERINQFYLNIYNTNVSILNNRLHQNTS